MSTAKEIPMGTRVKFDPLGDGVVEGVCSNLPEIVLYIVRFDNPIRLFDGQWARCAVIPSDMLYAADPS